MKEKQIAITEVIEKPEFKGEIKAEIKGVSQIEDNIKEVKTFAEELNNYYQTVIWTEDTLNDAKNEKANINKFKTKVADFRKQIVAEYKKPIELFETTAKETEKILINTYENINSQVSKYEDKVKEEIKTQCQEYFNECAKSENIDFITFDNMQTNITLGMRTKSGELTKKTKEEIVDYIAKIVSDITLINAEEYKTEILVEYKKTLNVSSAILEVKNRMKQIEEEKQKQIEIDKQNEIEQEVAQKVDNAIENTMNAPIVEEPKKKYNVTFKVCGTLDQLRDLKKFLVNGGYEYEQQ